jgi:hypothetical protein
MTSSEFVERGNSGRWASASGRRPGAVPDGRARHRATAGRRPGWGVGRWLVGRRLAVTRRLGQRWIVGCRAAAAPRAGWRPRPGGGSRACARGTRRWLPEVKAASGGRCGTGFGFEWIEVASWRREREGNAQFSNSTYIHGLTDKYRWTIPVSHAPPIFVASSTSPTNIGHVYSSMMWLNRWI